MCDRTALHSVTELHLWPGVMCGRRQDTSEPTGANPIWQSPSHTMAGTASHHVKAEEYLLWGWIQEFGQCGENCDERLSFLGIEVIFSTAELVHQGPLVRGRKTFPECEYVLHKQITRSCKQIKGSAARRMTEYKTRTPQEQVLIFDRSAYIEFCIWSVWLLEYSGKFMLHWRTQSSVNTHAHHPAL